jgi:hypothetical protein
VSITSKWSEIKQLVAEVAGIVGSVAGVVAATVPPAAPVAVTVAAICAVLAGGNYLQRAVPDKYLPEPMRTGTRGVMPKADPTVAED